MRLTPGDDNHAADRTPSDLAWRVMGLVNLYRLLVTSTLFVASRFSFTHDVLNIGKPASMALVCTVYFFAGIGLMALRRLPIAGLRTLTLTHALVDSLGMAWILWASNGVAGGLGILLVLPIGAMAMLARNRDAFFMAASAAVAVLVQQVLVNLAAGGADSGYVNAGVLGAVIFIAALSVRPLANRLVASEALVRKQELDLANLAQLSQYIVQHLRESLLVVDEADRIRLINEPAAGILGAAHALPESLLGESSPRLLFLLSAWRKHQNAQEVGTFAAADGTRLIQPHFARLGGARPGPVLIFLEDTSLLTEKVQQSKLAALGRLSASIAHEIRTPVGAMSHASQLLGESTAIATDDRRLTQIIRDNAERVSRIIDNVLELSRRNARQPERIALAQWIGEFHTEFCATQQLTATQLRVVIAAGDAATLDVQVDPTQLQQILWNLCQNALTHGRNASGENPAVELRVGRHASNARPCLEVIDQGPGIAGENMERVFEPFFTTAPRGTGLGLFLARELAQANGITLLHETPPRGGSLFRLVFSDPGRWQE